MHWKLFADLAEIAGDDEIAVDVEATEPTIADGLDALIKVAPELESRIYTDDGALEPHLNLLQNGAAVGDQGIQTALEADDELALFPPVSGG